MLDMPLSDLTLRHVLYIIGGYMALGSVITVAIVVVGLVRAWSFAKRRGRSGGDHARQ